MGPQRGPVGCNIVSYKLTEDRPTSGSLPQRIGRVVDVSAIADTACATKCVQELLIGLKCSDFELSWRADP